MMKVLLCGGGNAIHVLASYIGSLDDYEVSCLSLYPGEANRLKEAMNVNDNTNIHCGIQCENDLPNCGIVYGKKPIMISDKAEDVAPGSDVVILAIPSFTHDLYLKELKFYLHKGVILGAMPGQSGFDLCVRHHLGRDFVDCCSIFATETLPWACRIIEYGKSVQVLGTKKEIGIVIAPPTATNGDRSTSLESVLKILQTLIGPKPVLKPSSNFLSLTLTNPNTVHPTISYGFYRNFEDLSVPFDDVPVFYQGVDYPTGQMLCKVSDEILSIRDEIVSLYPTLNLSCMLHIETILLRYYSDDIEDKTNLSTMLQTSRAHRGLVHPMKELKTPEGTTKYLPNFQNRYFTEVPCGMIVIRGIAELAGVETPMLDEVITWCQNKMNKEFLVDGKLCGKDIHQSRCPEAYGFTDLDTFLKANHYLDGPSPTSSTEEEEQKIMNDGTLSVKHGFVQGRVVESRRSGPGVGNNDVA